MAPPRRRKVGLTRKDAAIDAMLVMGFSRKLISQTITELLKVYGGNEGWRFVEMDSYKALIEAILEKVGQEEDCLQDDDIGGSSQKCSEAGSSSVPPPPPPVCESISALSPPADDGLDSESQTETAAKDPPLAIPEPECNVVLSAAGDREEEEEEAVAGPPDPISNLNNAPCFEEHPAPIPSLAKCNAFTPPAEHSEVAGPPDPVSNLNNTSMASTIDEHHDPILPFAEHNVYTSETQEVPGPPDPVSSTSHERRPPCHGFLVRRKRGYCDEPTNLVELEPSAMPEELLRLLGRREKLRARKRRWDVGSKRWE